MIEDYLDNKKIKEYLTQYDIDSIDTESISDWYLVKLLTQLEELHLNEETLNMAKLLFKNTNNEEPKLSALRASLLILRKNDEEFVYITELIKNNTEIIIKNICWSYYYENEYLSAIEIFRTLCEQKYCDELLLSIGISMTTWEVEDNKHAQERTALVKKMYDNSSENIRQMRDHLFQFLQSTK